jgi:TldD protein
MNTRRDFIKGMSAGAILLATSDLMGDLIAQTPVGRVLESKFKGMADIALAECRRAGCSYADIRFTRNLTLPGVAGSATTDEAAADAGKWRLFC